MGVDPVGQCLIHQGGEILTTVLVTGPFSGRLSQDRMVSASPGSTPGEQATLPPAGRAGRRLRCDLNVRNRGQR